VRDAVFSSQTTQIFDTLPVMADSKDAKTDIKPETLKFRRVSGLISVLASFESAMNYLRRRPHKQCCTERFTRESSGSARGLLSWNGRVIKEYIDTKDIQKKLQKKDIPNEHDLYANNIDVDLDKPSEIVKTLNAEVDLALNIVKKAVFLESENRQEARWESMLLDTVFMRLRTREPPARLVIYSDQPSVP
jgi:hypothetical protein